MLSMLTLGKNAVHNLNKVPTMILTLRMPHLHRFVNKFLYSSLTDIFGFTVGSSNLIKA